MSSTQLLHSLSLLLLLPLRCRRNCNTFITLAIWLLSALSAVIHKDHEGRQQAAEKNRERSRLRERPSEAAAPVEKDLQRLQQGPGEEEQQQQQQQEEDDTPYIATKVAHKRQSADQNLTTSRGTTSARGTGTGAALTSWQSSHSHRSPGASSSAQEEHNTVELTSPPIASRGATTKPTVRSIPSRITRSRGGINNTTTTATADVSTRHIHIHSSCSTSPRLRSWLAAGLVSSIAT
ncbi:uncharacterized protein Dana_GF12557, isoform E [Drosophila ananassae]|uniref:Uncharacterized protein, isoform A n=1 Tax=Drosophila ananassae TaxID=7217 RepID=B3MFC3_DROAN|nr:uncharacterized protein LOC6495407 [Drosophila ananassae]XP_014763296.1 uncharacterized protein LOC6495407 [Drosophila ananassae]XP_014763298.1 uncharacterized protein LOC6495407 [Drosophila ananassae]XP_032307211.1 uncharacterized protein LOC6495407 [Drosophila ananassae]XP_032307212.1 uncharacterized protein LOC6495407 [Drosophila ananassae]XP_044571779.1 uncharacterized protein LOC6495407 [Drosophila ananassae]EDV35597.1 uncharacterized protein Dana_GF12557, isoform A [Drosophila ananas